MKPNPTYSLFELRQYLVYNPNSGVFRVLQKGINLRYYPTKAHPARNLQIQFKGFTTSASRVVYFYIVGTWPTHTVKSIDKDLLNLAWTNLRMKRTPLTSLFPGVVV